MSVLHALPMPLLHVHAAGHVDCVCPSCISLKWKRKIKSEMNKKLKAKRSETTSVSFRFRAGRKVGNTMNRKD
jgi:hypothetical protein